LISILLFAALRLCVRKNRSTTINNRPAASIRIVARGESFTHAKSAKGKEAKKKFRIRHSFGTLIFFSSLRLCGFA